MFEPVLEFAPHTQHVNLRMIREPTRLRQSWNTGVPRSYETPPSKDPTVVLCLGPYKGPRGGALFLMSEVPLTCGREGMFSSWCSASSYGYPNQSLV